MGNNYTNNPPTYKGEMQNGKKHGKGVYYSQTESVMKENGRTTKSTVKEHFISLMALITKVNIRTVSLTVKEFLHLNQEQSTKVCSKMEIQLT